MLLFTEPLLLLPPRRGEDLLDAEIATGAATETAGVGTGRALTELSATFSSLSPSS